MDENTFRAPEREDRDLPPSEESGSADAGGGTGRREDRDLPAEAYIEHASTMFNFERREEGERLTRVAAVPPAGGGQDPSFPSEDRIREEDKKRENARYPSQTPGQGGGTPAPPWIKSGEGDPPEGREKDGGSSAPQAPDPSLMPERTEEEAGKDRQMKRLKRIVAGLCVVIVLLAGAVIFILRNGGAGAGADKDKAGSDAEGTFVRPQTASEIADFYQKAVNKVKKEGEAGYRRKSWQTISELNLTGIEFADNMISSVFDEYFTPEENAKTETYTKGTEFAKSRFPGFELQDDSVILSAGCVPSGSNYRITLVFNGEDTPTEADSFLGKVSDTVLLWDTQIEPILTDISQLKAYSDLHIRYHDMTITAELSQDARFVSLKHFVVADVDIGSARVSIFTFKDKYLHFESIAEYTDFVY